AWGGAATAASARPRSQGGSLRCERSGLSGRVPTSCLVPTRCRGRCDATCDARRRPASNRAAASVAPLVLLVRARSPDLVAAALRPEIRLAFYRDQEVDRLQHAAHGRIVRQLACLVHLAEPQG